MDAHRSSSRTTPCTADSLRTHRALKETREVHRGEPETTEEPRRADSEAVGGRVSGTQVNTDASAVEMNS